MSNSIPAKVLMETLNIYSLVLHQVWNDEILQNCQFPENLKLPDITLSKTYRHVSVLPTLSKFFAKYKKDYAKSN